MNIYRKIRFQIFSNDNPNTIFWNLLFLKHRLPYKFKNYLIKRFSNFFTRNIQYFGEFGYELIAVIPYAYWLYKRKKLNATKSVRDTKCLYFFSKNHTEIDIKRRFMDVYDFPLGDIHVAKLDTSQWFPPPYKKEYKNKEFIWEKPICVICNKYTSEWGGSPVNFLSVKVLSYIFKLLKNRYQIIYNRPISKNIVIDEQKELLLNDIQIIKKKFPKIILMHELAGKNNHLTYNELQMMIYANSDHFISVQGGSSVFVSYFKGKNIIFAKKGGEIRNYSYNWYNKISGSQIFHADNYIDLIKTIKKEFL